MKIDVKKHFSVVKEKQHEIFWITVLLLSSVCFFEISYRPGRSFGIWLDNEFLISPMFHSLATHSNFNGLASYLPQFLGGLDIQGFQQFTPLYPFYFISSNLFSSPEAAIYGINFLVHLHLLVFVVGAYFLLRVLEIHGFAASFGALLMVFNVNTLSYATWVNLLAPYAWIPWILGALYRALRKGNFGSWTLFYFFCTLLVFSSPAQPLIHTFFLVSIILISEIWSTRKNVAAKTLLFSSIKNCLLVSPVFLAIISPILLPAIISTGNQIRWIGNFPAVIGHGKIPFGAFLTTQVELKEIPNLFFAPSVSREVGGVYLGFIVICLVFYGLAFLRKHQIWRLFFIIGLYSLASSFGENFGLAYLNYNIPLLNLIREPSRFLVIVHLSFAICAAIALNDICVKSFNRNGKNESALAGHKFYIGGKLFSLVGAILIFSFSIAQSNSINWKSPDVSQSEYETGSWQDLEKVLEKINQLDPSNAYRVIFGGKLSTQKASMFSSFYDLRTLNTYINPLPLDQFNSIYFYNSLPSSYKELLGARFLVCEECTGDELKSYPSYKEIWKFGNFKLFENLKAHFYLTVPEYVTYFPEGVSNFQRELEQSEFPGDSVFVQEIDLATPRTSRTECKVSEISQNQFEHFSANVFCETNGVLVVNSFNDENWRARVNGSVVTPISVNGHLVGVNLQVGFNSVEISHEPILRNHLFRYGGIFIAAYVLPLAFKNNKAKIFRSLKRKIKQGR